MTTAHRPTFDPARGKEALRGPAYHQRLLPAHTQLKFRKAGQGGAAGGPGADDDADAPRDLRAELLAAEAAHYSKLNGGAPGVGDENGDDISAAGKPRASHKRLLENGNNDGDGDDDAADDPDAKRRRILAETRDIDADDSDDDDNEKRAGSGSDQDDDSDDDDSDSDSDDEDETALVQRELERIKREKAERRAAEEAAQHARDEDQRERDIALGNPLLNKPNFDIKRRWDDDVVFKNQARGTDEKGRDKEFINDLLRSDFHKRFMSKYVR